MSIAAVQPTVYTRAAWADAWVAVPYLYVQSAVECVAPEVPVATLVYDFGRIMRAGATSYANYARLAILDRYVKIEFTDINSTVVRWVGVLTDGSESPSGEASGQPSGRQTFTARGLEHVLDLSPITGAMVEGFDWDPLVSDFVPVRTDWLPPFNASTQGGSILGNRSSARDAGDAYYYFSTTPGIGTDLWTVPDILEYALAIYAPSGVTWSLGGQVADLAGASGFDQTFDANGLTVKKVLDALIDRRRGYSYCLRYDEGTNAVSIHVFSQFAANVTVGAVTLNANAEQAALDIKSEIKIKDPRVRFERSTVYDRVRAVGGRVKACFSVGANHLENGWTETEETAYKAAASATAGYAALFDGEKAALNDRFRKDDSLSRVYSLFRLGTGWNWSVNDVEDGDASVDALLQCSDAGVIAAGNLKQAFFDRGVLDFIPLYEGRDYGTTLHPITAPSDMPLRPRKPFAVVKDSAGNYMLADKPTDADHPAGRVEPSDRAGGVYVRFPVPHVFAKSRWHDTEPSNVEPVYNYDDLILTLCVPTDATLHVVETAAGYPIAEYLRELVIRVPDCEAWWVAENTVVGIGADGTLTRLADGSTLIRDDSARLSYIAKLALQWYGAERAAAVLPMKGIQDYAAVGGLITTLTYATGTDYTLNSIVTRQAWDFDSQETTLETGFWGVDWTSVAPVNQPMTLSQKAVAEQMRNLISQVADWALGWLP